MLSVQMAKSSLHLATSLSCRTALRCAERFFFFRYVSDHFVFHSDADVLGPDNRWCPSAPGGFPHLSDKDDEYKGFKIKAGTMVIPNVWSLHRNEERFPEASVFKPERFFDEAPTFNKLVEGHYGFGFGRR